jgi:hypothetical protein
MVRGQLPRILSLKARQILGQSRTPTRPIAAAMVEGSGMAVMVK